MKQPKPFIHRSRSHLLLLAIFLSGFSSIIYQLVWTRYLHQVFGNSVYAVSTVLTCYMLGLVLGSIYCGRLADRSRKVGRLFGSLEALIGIYGLCSPLIFQVVMNMNIWVFQQVDPGNEAKILLRIALCFLFLLMPTFLMGGTFPVMVKYYNRYVAGIGKDLGAVYAVNTLGAALGALLAGFYWIRMFGLNNSLMLAVLCNLLVVCCILFVHKRYPHFEQQKISNHKKRDELPPTASPKLLWLLGSAFALSGFTALSYEVLWTRSLTYFFRDTVYDFALVLTVFLTGIVLGSFLCSRIVHKIQQPIRTFGNVQILIGLFSLLSLFVINRLPYAINHLQTMSALYSQYGEHYWLVSMIIKWFYAVLVMFIPTCLFGATYPLISRILIQHARHVGSKVGLLNGLNTLGSAFGALLSGFVFLSLFGLHQSIQAMAFINCGVGLIVIGFVVLKDRRLQVKAFAPLLLLVVIAVTAATPAWDKLRMSISFLEPDQDLESVVKLLYYNENSADLVSVVEVVPLRQKFLTTNRLYTQNTSNMESMEDHRRLGHIPLLLHPQPKSVLVVGLGAGMTLSGVGEHPISYIDCVEISENVIQAARLFADENRHVLDDPRVRLHTDDGRSFMQTRNQQYDVIIGDIYFPMSSGSGNMYSVEYYRAVKERLAPAGLFAQWLPMHQLSLQDMKIIIRSFKEVFPHTSLWFGMIGDSAPVLGVIGTKELLSIDYELLNSKIEQLRMEGSLIETNLGTPYLVLSHFIMEGPAIDNLVQGLPLNTDDQPIIEYSVPKLFHRAYEIGLENLYLFSIEVESVFPHLTNLYTEQASITEQMLYEHSLVKKIIIRELYHALEDSEQRWVERLSMELNQYPHNEDLLYWVQKFVGL